MIPAYRPLALIISIADSTLSAGSVRAFNTLAAAVSLGNLARRYRSKNSFNMRGLSVASRRAARSSPSCSGATNFFPSGLSFMTVAFTPPSVKPYAIDAPVKDCQALLVGLIPSSSAMSGG